MIQTVLLIYVITFLFVCLEYRIAIPIFAESKMKYIFIVVLKTNITNDKSET